MRIFCPLLSIASRLAFRPKTLEHTFPAFVLFSFCHCHCHRHRYQIFFPCSSSPLSSSKAIIRIMPSLAYPLPEPERNGWQDFPSIKWPARVLAISLRFALFARMASPRLDCSGESLFCCEDICASPSDDGEQGSTNNPIFGCSDSSSGIPITVTEMQEPHSQDAVSALIKREISHSPSPDYLEKYETKLLDEESRHKAVSWFFKARAFFRFSPLTVVLSVNYLDRFLSRHEVPMRKSWMIDLVSVACLSLAAKMEEVEVPLLVDLQVAPDYFFEPCTVLRMELLLLSTLEWRADSVTPFSYIEYFICKCRLSGPIYQNLASQITELILLAVKDLNFLRHHYCSIAAAAILCAIKEMLPSLLEEHKKNIFSMFPSCLQDLSAECLDLMVEQRYTPPNCFHTKS